MARQVKEAATVKEGHTTGLHAAQCMLERERVSRGRVRSGGGSAKRGVQAVAAGRSGGAVVQLAHVCAEGYRARLFLCHVGLLPWGCLRACLALRKSTAETDERGAPLVTGG